MHDARAAVERDEVGRDHFPAFAALRRRVGEDRLVLQTDQLAPLARTQDLNVLGLVRRALEDRGDQFLRENELFVAGLHGGVFEFRVNREPHVARQRPGRRGPGEEAEIGACLASKSNRDGRIVHLVPLPHLTRRQHRAALRPPPDHLVILEQQPAVEQFRQHHQTLSTYDW